MKESKKGLIIGVSTIIIMIIMVIIAVNTVYNIVSYEKRPTEKQTTQEEEIAENISQRIKYIYKKEGDLCFAASGLEIVFGPVDCENVKDYIVNKKTYLKFHPER